MTKENQAQEDAKLEQQEQGEELDDRDDEKAEQAEELDEETAQAIADYSDKIAALDGQLEAYRTGNIEAMKRSQMKAMHYSDKQIDRYLSHVSGETADEIKASVFELMTEIPPVDPYGDPSAMNGAKAKPKAVDRLEVGRNAI